MRGWKYGSGGYLVKVTFTAPVAQGRARSAGGAVPATAPPAEMATRAVAGAGPRFLLLSGAGAGEQSMWDTSRPPGGAKYPTSWRGGPGRGGGPGKAGGRGESARARKGG